MASITEHVIKLQELTQTNLEILRAINDSFFTKQNHLSVNIGENRYAIPSFLSLENKLNSLSANFENLVNAPESGEAFFDFNGNTRAINVRTYTSVPNSLILKPVSEYGVDKNDIFKDFMTPTPYINLDMGSLPNDTVQVVVKKIIPIHDDLIETFHSSLHSDEDSTSKSSIKYAYKDLYKILSLYEQDKDYIEYDTKMDLPIRKNIGSGVYVIESILEDFVDENLDNYITIKLRSDMGGSIYMNSLKYRLFDETIEKMLRAGDQLVTFDGQAKMEITEIRTNSNTIVVRVVNGEFLNLVPSTTNNPQHISTLSKIKFYSPISFNEDKYIKVPLEEDQYVFISVAALNSRMNVQSPWGSGLMLDTYQLTRNNIKFDQYYKDNVRNVGDVLFEITSMMSNTLTGYSESEYRDITEFVPEIKKENLQVIQINKHLNDSVVVQNIRALYSQKKEYQSQLSEIQKEIDNINNDLASISFDDTTGVRSAYTDRLINLSTRKNELVTSISKTMDEISIAANNSETPIENAKYRIRGFFDIGELDRKDHIKGIRVQYRYKNIDQEQGNAFTINDKFVFSDWNDMPCVDRERISNYIDGGYQFKIQDDNSNINEPSFNQIDIPISQGETVDMRLKIVYDYGYPFVAVSSDWSPIVNIKFPEEYLKNVQILDIISENNNDIESNRFNNILKDGGIPEHIGDKIIDQDITYYHKPENIASGFYTEERRIIPLKDKLNALDAALAELRSEVLGSRESIKVSIKHGESLFELNPYQTEKITVAEYNSFDNDDDGLYESENGIVSTVLNISILNDSDNVLKLFSMFPGDKDTQIQGLTNYKFDKSSYCDKDEKGLGIYFSFPGKENVETEKIQGGNQFIYFRVNDPNTGETTGIDSGKKLPSLSENGSILYPKLSNKYGLCIESNTIGSYLVLGPKEEILIPIIFEYKLAGDASSTMSKMCFEIFPSLYKDPIPYIFEVRANKTDSVHDKLISTNRRKFGTWWGKNGVIFSPKFK